MEAYSDPISGAPNGEFIQAVSLFLWAWFLLTLVYTVAAITTNLVLLLALISTDLTLLFTALSYNTGVDMLGTAGCAMGFVTCFFGYWAAVGSLWTAYTPIKVPMFPLGKKPSITSPR